MRTGGWHDYVIRRWRVHACAQGLSWVIVDVHAHTWVMRGPITFRHLRARGPICTCMAPVPGNISLMWPKSLQLQLLVSWSHGAFSVLKVALVPQSDLTLFESWPCQFFSIFLFCSSPSWVNLINFNPWAWKDIQGTGEMVQRRRSQVLFSWGARFSSQHHRQLTMF